MSTIEENNKDPREYMIIVEHVSYSIEEFDTKYSILSSVFESMGDAVYYTDPERRILAWNRAAEQMTGFSKEEATGRFCRDLLNHTDESGLCLCDRACPLLEVTHTPPKLLSKNVWMKKKGGQRILVELNCSCVMDKEGNLLGMVEVFRDRTKQWELERMKEDFIAAVTHDLKSPISSIMGFSELIADPKFGEISPSKLDYVRLIRQSGNVLLTLIGNIVDASRIEAGQMHYTFENFPLDKFLKELRETFGPLSIKNNVTLQISYPDNAWVYGDRNRIMQVFHNLLSNAFRYTPKDGTISIIAEKRDGHIKFEVADTGRGIKHEDRERIFQKFGQARGERQGTGLGLFIAKTILAGHESEISFESQEGKGTKFFFSLVEGTPQKEVTYRKGNILIVGEESDNIRLVRLILQKAGHRIDSIAGGLNALQQVTQKKPDIIILHYPLPDLRIEDFNYRIRNDAATKDIPLVLLSAVRVPEWESLFKEIVMLPVNMVVLKDSIQKLLVVREKDEGTDRDL